MDTQNFEDRMADVMKRIVLAPAPDVAQLTDDVRRLKGDIDEALAAGVFADDPDQADALRSGSRHLLEMLETPGMLDMMIQDAAEPLDRYPEICDIVEDGDLGRLRVALQTWDVNARFGKYYSTVLYHAMSNMHGCNLSVIEALLDAGADPRMGLAKSNVLHGLGFGRFDGIAPDDLARVIRRCVDLGADINQRTDKLMWTPLICAASEWNTVAVEALLLAGADPLISAGDVAGVCGAGRTAAHFADGHPETLAVFARFARPN